MKAAERPYKFDALKRRACLALLAAGWGQDDIARSLALHRQTISAAVNHDSEFSKLAKQAIDTRDAKVESALLAAAEAGNVTAQIFWLKNRQPGKWRDVQRQETTGPDGQPLTQQNVIVKVEYVNARIQGAAENARAATATVSVVPS